MTEKDLIKKIQKLKQIKPRKEWVLLCKNQILGTEEKIKGFVFNGVSIKLVFRTLFQRRAILQPILVLLLITIIGAAGIIYFKEQRDPNEIVLNNNEIALTNNLIEIEKLIPILKQTRFNISQAIIDLQKITKTEQALLTKRMVTSTIKAGEIVVSEARKIEQKIIDQDIRDNKQVLAIMTNEIIELENALLEMENSLNNVYASIAKREIKNLEKILRPDQQALQALLEQSKQHFEAGEYDQSLMIINKISQIVYQ